MNGNIVILLFKEDVLFPWMFSLLFRGDRLGMDEGMFLHRNCYDDRGWSLACHHRGEVD